MSVTVCARVRQPITAPDAFVPVFVTALDGVPDTAIVTVTLAVAGTIAPQRCGTLIAAMIRACARAPATARGAPLDAPQRGAFYRVPMGLLSADVPPPPPSAVAEAEEAALPPLPPPPPAAILQRSTSSGGGGIVVPLLFDGARVARETSLAALETAVMRRVDAHAGSSRWALPVAGDDTAQALLLAACSLAPPLVLDWFVCCEQNALAHALHRARTLGVGDARLLQNNGVGDAAADATSALLEELARRLRSGAERARVYYGSSGAYSDAQVNAALLRLLGRVAERCTRAALEVVPQQRILPNGDQ
jgi:hypothetical protein